MDAHQVMDERDTSSGLTFDLRWGPPTAENEDEMDTRDFVDLPPLGEARVQPGQRTWVATGAEAGCLRGFLQTCDVPRDSMCLVRPSLGDTWR